MFKQFFLFLRKFDFDVKEFKSFFERISRALLYVERDIEYFDGKFDWFEIEDFSGLPENIQTDLKNKTLAVDSSIFLYQFLTTIRQRDGSLLMDSKGNVTSHLTGLFSRNCNLIKNGLKLIYVFDGKPPALKNTENKNRKKKKTRSTCKI